MLSIGLWRWYINITVTILDTSYTNYEDEYLWNDQQQFRFCM
jgi:hypothetical protein